MSQANERSTTRRAILAGAPAAAAAALGAGAVANGLAAAVAASSAIDPVFALIAEHGAAAAAYATAVYAEGDLLGPEMEAAGAVTCAAADHAHALFWEVLHAKPTTIAGVAALLAHVRQSEVPRYEYQDCRRTHLTSALDLGGEWKRAAEDFPVRLAETIRNLIGGQS